MGSLAVMYTGFAVLAFMMFGWFGTVIRESESGVYNEQVDRSFRMGMGWFIFSEVMFFAAFFGALYYVREIVLEQLAQTSANPYNNLTGEWIWPAFKGATWPTAGPEGLVYKGAELAEGAKLGAKEFLSMKAMGIPALNTLILLSSGVTLTIAHWGLKKGNRNQLILWLAATVLLGFLFIGFQAYEYVHAYSDEMNLRLSTGAYGSTFFMLTGFHGLHVLVGATILTVVLLRCIKGHFSEEHHFAFEAGAWYWHFVDVVWLGLFIFVYWLV